MLGGHLNGFAPMPFSGWRRYRVWEWIQHNRSLQKSALGQPPFPRRSVYLLGSVPVQAMMRLPARTTATALQRVTVICDAYSIKLRMQQRGPRGASSRSYIVAQSRAWGTIKPLEPSLID